MLSDLLTTKQAADQLGVSVRRVHTIVANGDLVPVARLDPPRGALFFAPSDIDTLEANLAASAP